MERIELLNRIVEEIAKSGAPVVFKGAILLNNILHQNNPSNVSRQTYDIDGNWVGEKPDIEKMKNVIQKAIINVDKDLKVEISRTFNEKRSAGFKIYSSSSDKDILITSIDLSVKNTQNVTDYISYISNVKIRGITVDKMIADKLHSISTHHIYRRTKDLIDLYILSFIADFNYDTIQNILKADNRELGSFEEYNMQYTELKHSYDKLEGIDNKPTLDELKERLDVFIKPFKKPNRHKL